MSNLLGALRRTAFAAAIGLGVLGTGAGAGLACDCTGNDTGNSTGYQSTYGQPYYGGSYGNYPCYGRECGTSGYYDRYEDGYYAYERLDPYRYYNPDYDDEYYDGGDCDDADCY
jgi:hypothetical protein